MAHYQINLESKIKAHVRTGKIFKKINRLFNQWPWFKLNSGMRIGYIVIVENALQEIKTQYLLLKTKEGKWLTEADDKLAPAIKIRGKWEQHGDDSIIPSIKKAIDDYENKQ